MSGYIPTRERRLQIILEVKAKMVQARLDAGRKQDAVRMAEFYDRIYKIVQAGNKADAGVHSWALAGIEKSAGEEVKDDDGWEVFH